MKHSSPMISGKKYRPAKRQTWLPYAIIISVQLFITANKAEGSEKQVLEGHSFHGEAFNEGPRQKAYLMKGMGRVRFPVTTDKQEAQLFFTQGV